MAVHVRTLRAWPQEPYRLSKVDRAIRREALCEIFEILGVRTWRKRLSATREIVHAIAWFHAGRERQLLHQKSTIVKGWFKEVARHSEGLARLASEYPRDFGWFVTEIETVGREEVQKVIDMLLKWAEQSHRYGRGRARTRKLDMGPIILIHRLQLPYLLRTNRNVSRSVDPVTGRHDPFIDFMHAVWRLAGVKKGHQAIIKDIRNWKAWRQTGGRVVLGEP